MKATTGGSLPPKPKKEGIAAGLMATRTKRVATTVHQGHGACSRYAGTASRRAEASPAAFCTLMPPRKRITKSQGA
jgi:hypothetical protein